MLKDSENLFVQNTHYMHREMIDFMYMHTRILLLHLHQLTPFTTGTNYITH